MNLKDVEWEPEPTPADILRQVRTSAKRCVTSHDVAKLRQLLLSDPINGAIPHELRGSIWLLLLGLRAEDLLAEDLNLFAKSARNAVSDDNSREQIQKDVERTRPALQRFKQRTVRGALLRLLSLFCMRRQVAYVQGFNELLAPFILLADTGGNPRIVYSLFNDFVSRFAPWMLDTSESNVFNVLKRAFKYFERLLLYHDPQLYWLLENNMMSPDLYATSWFVTLFARNFTVECVMALWDLLLLSDNPLGITFFGIAMLTGRREELLSVDASRLPETLMMLTAKSGDEVRELWSVGMDMQNLNTPPSFLRLMNDRLLNQPNLPRGNAVSAARSMQASVCLQTTPDDLVSGDATFAAWDCRTEAEFHAGHLAQANWLPLDELRACSERGAARSDLARDELSRAVEFCREHGNQTHICLVGSGHREEDDADINILAKHLTKIGVPYVSTLRGGFKAALAVAQSGSALTSVELVSFDEERHKQARNMRLNAAALARQQPYIPQRRVEPRHPDINDLGAPSPTSTASTPPAVVPMSTESTPKIWSDSASSTANALPHPTESVPRFSVRDIDPSPRRAPIVAPTAPPLPAYISPSESEHYGAPDSPEVEVDKWSTLAADPLAPITTTATNHENEQIASSSAAGDGEADAPETPVDLVSPAPGERVKSSTRGRKSSKSRDKNANNPWGSSAGPNWLSDESLTYPLDVMPKGYTVDVMDDSVMAGLRLFPCRAKAEGRGRMRGKTTDFRRRYVGVAKNYFLLLAPHSTRNHLLEVKVIRYLQDIVRIAFKRQRPELVTFELRTERTDDAPNEQIICVMPDGLKECVKLVKSYLLADDDDLDLTPTSAASSTPLSSGDAASPQHSTTSPKHESPRDTVSSPKQESPDRNSSTSPRDQPLSVNKESPRRRESLTLSRSESPRERTSPRNETQTPRSVITEAAEGPTDQQGALNGAPDASDIGKKLHNLDLSNVENETGPPFLTTPTVSSSKFFDDDAKRSTTVEPNGN